jgi:hypothetical protein
LFEHVFARRFAVCAAAAGDPVTFSNTRSPYQPYPQPSETKGSRPMPDVADKSTLEPHHIRSLALAGAVVGVVLLPIAAAQANPTGSGSTAATQISAQNSVAGSAAPTATPTAAQALGAEYCGAATTVGSGATAVQAQSCVEQADGTASAKVYVSNGSTVVQTVTLNLTRSDGTLIQVQCAIAAGDTSGTCATDALPTTSGSGAFNAIAEMIAAGRPLSDGVLHTESGLVAPSAGPASAADQGSGSSADSGTTPATGAAQ